MICVTIWVETKAKYQKKMELVQQELDIQRKNGIKEFELRWNSHNNNLIEEHNKALSDLREQSVNHMQQHLDKNDSNRVKVHTFNILLRLTPKKFQIFLGLQLVIHFIIEEPVNYFFM